jgi:hypothetical protein
MSGTAIRSRGSPVPTEPGPEPLGAAPCLRWSPALLDASNQTMHPQQIWVDAGEWMPLPVPVLGFDLSAECLDGGVRTPLLEPSLVTASLTTFTAFFSRHQCPP